MEPEGFFFACFFIYEAGTAGVAYILGIQHVLRRRKFVWWAIWNFIGLFWKKSFTIGIILPPGMFDCTNGQASNQTTRNRFHSSQLYTGSIPSDPLNT